MATLTATGVTTSNGTLDGYYTGSSSSNTSFPVGSYIQMNAQNISSGVALNGSFTPKLFFNGGQYTFAGPYGSGTAISGTWVCRGGIQDCGFGYLTKPELTQRIA